MIAPSLRRCRTISGASAVLLPFDRTGRIDWTAFSQHLQRTIDSGLTPAVNMDTGFGPVLGPEDRRRVLGVAQRTGAGFIAGAHVDDEPGAPFVPSALHRAIDEIASFGGTPILFPSHGAAALSPDDFVELHRDVARRVDRFLGFELGAMFHPAGCIHSIDVFAEMLAIRQMTGLKHSSLRRDLEWQRLEIRDRDRPDFSLMTGNDLAIDMVVYGSDHLLGLSTFAPEAFAVRDRAWAAGDEARFWELNDLLQYLGQFAFRPPVPAYRHDAAMFLRHCGRIGADRTHRTSPRRPDSDREVLAEIAARLADLLDVS